MGEQDVEDWLKAYGRAWIEGDPDEAAALFTVAAEYHETPFSEPLRGRDQIRQYWQEGAADAQEDVRFSAQIWSIAGNTAIAGWQAAFRRKASGRLVKLDGVFRLVFSSSRNGVICNRLEEWWHRRESQS
ncbi:MULTISPECIES: nuclear transport factor 2 family protein [unclassified Leisingera]|uniref:nuclear transport factor 2 family protein n=1 Tax=unclassified Leisingera TaxID=2614906 RepID=UPI0021A2E4F0|nr:nuclear transport factor 2 family protein [Leisingera sp. M523]UWQ29052.1 nuclear transport factor 2 family protein [Leisingera sp. M523]